MADCETVPQIKILKNSKILVNVEEVLQDILVVSYAFESKLFEGVLLDSTKKSLPCGVPGGTAALAGLLGGPAQSSPRDGDEDRLFSVSQRFSYVAEARAPPPFHLRRAVRPPARYKNARMTVRLRPRQVLCSKCRSICNENSENVDVSRRRADRKLNPTGGDVPSRSPRPLFSENQRDNQPKVAASPPSAPEPARLRPSLIPKLSRLQPSEISSALGGGAGKLCYWGPAEPRRDEKLYGPPLLPPPLPPPPPPPHELAFEARCSPGAAAGPEEAAAEAAEAEAALGETEGWDAEAGGRMVLRKKRSVGSMEDLWDESVFEAEEGAKRQRAAAGPGAAGAAAGAGAGARTTPVIKISFGSPGEGTVLKIPARSRGYAPSDGDADDGRGAPRDAASAKAAKKALKKAKREARRKLLGGASPGGASPGRAAGPGTGADAAAFCRRRHKHKVKHKKKHREERRRSGLAEADAPDSYSAIKERCLRQKLSINLKRLSAHAYAHCDAAAGAGTGAGAGPNGCKSPAAGSSCSASEDLSSDDPGEGGGLPDFPAAAPQTPARPLASCLSGDGRRLAVGDVVWGKIHGFPWWPGKVLSISMPHKDDGILQAPQAHVAWYGSSTSSLMPCDQLSPFLETFKARYNKKKRGPYKEAIRQATSEARQESLQPTQPLSASPREVNVVS